MCRDIYIYMYIYTYIMYINTYIYIYREIYIYIDRLCVYIYIYIYIHTHTYTSAAGHDSQRGLGDRVALRADRAAGSRWLASMILIIWQDWKPYVFT